MAGRYFGIPFAATGDRITVPDATQPDGSVSFTQGFGFDYERPNTDPAYKPVPREGTNGLFHDITEALGIAQRQGVSDWTVDAQPYPVNALVRHTDKVWRSLVANNNVTPTEGASWTELSTVPQATEAVAGIIEIATTAEAQALTDDTTALTPKKLSDALDANVFGANQTWQNVTASRANNVTYTNSTGKPIMVSLSAGGGSVPNIEIHVDGVITFMNRNAFSSATEVGCVGIIPAGSTYKAVIIGTLTYWKELR